MSQSKRALNINDLTKLNQNYSKLDKAKKRSLFCNQHRQLTFFKKKNNLSQHKFKTSVCFSKSLKLEFIYISLFRKCLKNVFKKTLKTKKYWIYWGVFYPLTKKSKNSRMGKGKGMLLRWVYICPAYHFFGRFNVFSVKRLSCALLKFSKLVKCSPIII